MAATTGPRDGFAKRIRAIETALSITTTKTDRVALQHRLEACETAASLTANPKGGLDARLKALEATL